jgi:tetratricopeptide (TPR) repeat protein
MLRRSLIIGSVLLLALSGAAQQQDNSAPPPAQNPPDAPAPQKKDSPAKDQAPKDQPKKSTADQNPFPEAQSEAAAHQQNSDPNAPQPQTTSQPGSAAKPDDQNPFPQQQSEKAAHQGQPADKLAAPGDSGDYSSSQVKGLDMPTTDVPNTGEAPPANLPPSTLPYNPKLARKDAEIGDYYMESGNWRGAYERFLEANRSDPGNPEAVFGLAESARRLSHIDEALRNYHLYLSALPNGPHAKEVRKALKELGAAPAA